MKIVVQTLVGRSTERWRERGNWGENARPLDMTERVENERDVCSRVDNKRGERDRDDGDSNQ